MVFTRDEAVSLARQWIDEPDDDESIEFDAFRAVIGALYNAARAGDEEALTLYRAFQPNIRVNPTPPTR